MKKRVMLLAVFGIIVMSSAVALAGGDGCNYGSHKTQAEAEKTDTVKPVATSVSDKSAMDKIVLVQGDKATQSTAETKK